MKTARARDGGGGGGDGMATGRRRWRSLYIGISALRIANNRSPSPLPSHPRRLLPFGRALEDFSCLIATSTALNQRRNRESPLRCQYLGGGGGSGGDGDGGGGGRTRIGRGVFARLMSKRHDDAGVFASLNRVQRSSLRDRRAIRLIKRGPVSSRDRSQHARGAAAAAVWISPCVI